MSESPYDPSDSLISLELTNQNSVDSDEPDSPESSCSLVFRNGEWQMPIEEEDMDYTIILFFPTCNIQQYFIPMTS